jgi:hypothetical protein
MSADPSVITRRGALGRVLALCAVGLAGCETLNPQDKLFIDVTMAQLKGPNGIDQRHAYLVMEYLKNSDPAKRDAIAALVERNGYSITDVGTAADAYAKETEVKAQALRQAQGDAALPILRNQADEIFKASPAGRAMGKFQTYLDAYKDPTASIDRAGLLAQVQGLIDVSYRDAGVAGTLAQRLRGLEDQATQTALGAGKGSVDHTLNLVRGWAYGQAAGVVAGAPAQAALLNGAVPRVVLNGVTMALDQAPARALAPAASAPGPAAQ